MAMVGVDSGSLYRRTHSLKSSGLVLGWRPLGAVLHSSNEPGELSQWLYRDDSTINIVLVIIIIIIHCVDDASQTGGRPLASFCLQCKIPVCCTYFYTGCASFDHCMMNVKMYIFNRAFKKYC